MSTLQKDNKKMTSDTYQAEEIPKPTIYAVPQAKIEGYVARAPKLHQPYYRKMLTNNKSKARAVKAKCLECGNWQIKEVIHCQVFECPLWRVRPYQKK